VLSVFSSNLSEKMLLFHRHYKKSMEKIDQSGGKPERVSRVILTTATPEDLDLVVEWESKEKNVVPWSKDKHMSMLEDPSSLYFMVNKKSTEEPIPVGYSILKKDSPDSSSVEFIRLVISDEYKSRGYGVWAFEDIWDKVFNQLNYEGIWHDVFVENHIAISLYDRLGYKKFGEGIDPITGRGLILYEMTKDDYLSR